jgi:hypothetical protein
MAELLVSKLRASSRLSFSVKNTCPSHFVFFRNKSFENDSLFRFCLLLSWGTAFSLSFTKGEPVPIEKREVRLSEGISWPIFLTKGCVWTILRKVQSYFETEQSWWFHICLKKNKTYWHTCWAPCRPQVIDCIRGLLLSLRHHFVDKGRL